MAGKFAKISRLEWVTLLLTACFAAGTLLWFHFGPPPGAVTFTGTGEPTAAEQQAVDRIHRIGQDKEVHVYRLVAEGTIEEKVMQLKESKAALFDAVVGEGEFASAAVTAEDVRELFAPAIER